MSYTFMIKPHSYLKKTVLEVKQDGSVIDAFIFKNRKNALTFAGGLYLKYPQIKQELNK